MARQFLGQLYWEREGVLAVQAFDAQGTPIGDAGTPSHDDGGFYSVTLDDVGDEDAGVVRWTEDGDLIASEDFGPLGEGGVDPIVSLSTGVVLRAFPL